MIISVTCHSLSGLEQNSVLIGAGIWYQTNPVGQIYMTHVPETGPRKKQSRLWLRFLGRVPWVLQFRPMRVFSCVDLIIVAYCLCDYILYLAIATFDGFPGAKVFRLVKMFRIIRSLRAVRVLRTVRSTRVFTPYYAHLRCIKRVADAAYKTLGGLIVTNSSLSFPCHYLLRAFHNRLQKFSAASDHAQKDQPMQKYNKTAQLSHSRPRDAPNIWVP